MSLSNDDRIDQSRSDGNIGSDSTSGRGSGDEGSGNGTTFRREAWWAFDLFRFRVVILLISHGEGDDKDSSGSELGPASDAVSDSSSISDVDDSRVCCPYFGWETGVVLWPTILSGNVGDAGDSRDGSPSDSDVKTDCASDSECDDDAPGGV